MEYWGQYFLLLFIKYINDLPLHVGKSSADDSSLHCRDTSIDNINAVLQNDVNEVKSWCDNNGMEINILKLKYMVI